MLNGIRTQTQNRRDAACDVVTLSIPALANVDRDQSERKARAFDVVVQLCQHSGDVDLLAFDSTLPDGLIANVLRLSTFKLRQGHVWEIELALHCKRCPLECPVDYMNLHHDVPAGVWEAKADLPKHQPYRETLNPKPYQPKPRRVDTVLSLFDQDLRRPFSIETLSQTTVP